MARTTVINPSFGNLRNFIEQLPDLFITQGEYIHDGRNKIKVFEYQGIKLNVKRYRIPFFINRLVYGALRQPKAVRAYEYAMRLRGKNINTPEPVAYITEKKYGLFGFSYFISIQVAYPRRFYEFGDASMTGENEKIIRDFAHFTARLHESGVYHRDYSPGNILFEHLNGQTEFCIVDINRMKFGTVSREEGCANFARLWGQKSMFRLIAREYARARGFNEEECEQLVLKSRYNVWEKVSRKKEIEFKLEL